MTVLQHLASPTGWWLLADVLLVVFVGVVFVNIDDAF